jgi:TrmH family RNA methyltransferase
MNLKNIRVVLVNPLYASNVGAVCRAMKNMGLNDLALVTPRCDVTTHECQQWACHANNILKKRRTCATLAEAIADCGLVAGATARPGLYREHTRTPRDWAPRLLAATSTGRIALVFGPEDNGLNNDDLALCTQLMRIPSSGRYASLNLAQAVMVVCYELFTATKRFKIPTERTPEAPNGSRCWVSASWKSRKRST